MDTATLSFYSVHAAAHAERYERAEMRGLHETLRRIVTEDSCVLEIGGGSGRDSKFLAGLGCSITYTDGCEEMLDQALSIHPELANNARIASFPLSDDDPLLDKWFDLVLCIAVIMHLDEERLLRSASQMSAVVATGGHLLLSHSRGGRIIAENRDDVGRLYVERQTPHVRRVFEETNLTTEQETLNSDGIGRHGISWITHLMRKTT